MKGGCQIERTLIRLLHILTNVNNSSNKISIRKAAKTGKKIFEFESIAKIFNQQPAQWNFDKNISMTLSCSCVGVPKTAKFRAVRLSRLFFQNGGRMKRRKNSTSE